MAFGANWAFDRSGILRDNGVQYGIQLFYCDLVGRIINSPDSMLYKRLGNFEVCAATQQESRN
ncbi:MAG: hypothetical protein ACLTCV_06675 [Oscillospiraceae bacterium]